MELVFIQARTAGKAPASSVELTPTLEFDGDIHPCWHVEPGQRVYGFAGWLHDVEQALVRTNLEVLPGILVDVRTADDTKPADLRGQRYRTGHPGAGEFGGFNYLRARLIQHFVVKSFEDYAHLLPGNHDSLSSTLQMSCVRRCGRLYLKCLQPFGADSPVPVRSV